LRLEFLAGMRKKNLYNFIAKLVLVIALIGSVAAAPNDLAWLTPYNVVWTSQSRNAAESMPCGGGDTGLNVWLENGELLCYVQRSGAFDENNQYLKLGRLRVRKEPNPFADGGEFRQELKLREGFVEITGKHGVLQARLGAWADVFNPVVHIEVKANQPVQVVAAYENWRQADVSLPNSPARPRFAALGWDDYPGEVTRLRDEVNFQGDAVLFYPGDRILLLPAWPKDWDVDSKLHAPKNTVVEVRYRNGKIENLIISPVREYSFNLQIPLRF
jgi:hypothetical protein